MIIFGLDGTLADCEHRRHFVDAYHPFHKGKYTIDSNCGWEPDWKAFYEACDKDTIIKPTLKFLKYILSLDEDIQIWSGRCESVRTQTENWLDAVCDIWSYVNLEKHMDYKHLLKMRPIGDNTPEYQLKERWLDELLVNSEKIDFVFDSDERSIRMWQRRGIFVFNCSQQGET